MHASPGHNTAVTCVGHSEIGTIQSSRRTRLREYHHEHHPTYRQHDEQLHPVGVQPPGRLEPAPPTGLNARSAWAAWYIRAVQASWAARAAAGSRRRIRVPCTMPTGRGPASRSSILRALRVSGWATYSPMITPEASAIVVAAAALSCRIPRVSPSDM